VLGEQRVDLLLVGPEVGEGDRRAVLGVTERLGRQIDPHVAGQGVGHDQRRGGEVGVGDVRMDSAGEVPVARQHGGVRGRIRTGRGRRQRTGVTHAGATTESGDVETEPVEVCLKATGFQEVGRRSRSGGQRCLGPRRRSETGLDGVAREQTRRHQGAGVGRVGATGDRGDGDIAAARPGRAVVAVRPGLAARGGNLGQRQGFVRSRRTGQCRRDAAQVDPQCRLETGDRAGCGVQQTLGGQVLLGQTDLLGRATGG